MYRRIGFLGCTLFFSWAVFLLPAKAQEGQPSGWKNLDAAAFTQYASPLLGDKEGRHVLIDHAWQRFLNDKSFIAKADWATVEAMTLMFSSAKNERTAQGRSEAEIDAQVVTLADRLVVRHATDRDLPLGSVDDLFERVFKLLDYQVDVLDKKKLRLKWGELRAESGDWKSLSLQQQIELANVLSEDSLDRTQMSARWTGSIKAPSRGRYTFYLSRGGAFEPKYQLWINGDLVLDSTTQTRSTTEFFVSKPVALRKGRPASLRLEVADMREGLPAGYGWLAGALLWQEGKDSGKPQLVPGSALAPPADFETESTTGLKGEYFSDKDLSTLVAERLDSSLEFVWSGAPALAVNEARFSEVLEHCVASLLGGKSLAGVSEADRPFFVIDTYTHLLDLLPLSARADLVKHLTSQRKLLSATETFTMARLIKSTYYLPGDEHLDLLAAWSQARSQPRFQPGNPRVGLKKNLRKIETGPTEGPFIGNWLYFRSIGGYLQGAHWNELEKLLSEHLERPDGHCNLAIAYISAFASSGQTRSSGKRYMNQFINRLDAKLAEESLTGDQRVTWLIARSFAAEVAIRRKPQLLFGKEYLEEASLVAQSQDYKFWALQELMARYSTLGDQVHLEPLLKLRKGQFTEAGQVEMMNACESMCSEHAESRQLNRKVRMSINQRDYIRDLRARIETVTRRGDTAAATRFQKLLNKAVSAGEK